MGNAAVIRRGSRTVDGTTGRRKQREAAAELSVQQDLSKYYGPTGSSDKQRTPPSIPPGPQYLPRNYGPDGSVRWLCQSTPRQADGSTTRPTGSGPMRQSDALDFEPSFYTPIDQQGSGRVAND